MARFRQWMKDKDPEGYQAYKTQEKERKQEERRQIKEQGMTNAAKQKLIDKKNEYKEKYNRALIYKTKLIRTQKKFETKRANMESAYKEVRARLIAIRKSRSCTNPKCKDALLE